MTIARHCLRVFDVPSLCEFYTGALGMRNFGTPEKPLLGYDQERCLLEFRSGANGKTDLSGNSFYWKIGITVRDLDHAVWHLRQMNWPVSDPGQFNDIGYLCHLRDPQGFAIELLQQGFEGREKPAGPGHAIGCQGAIAHITLRINDIAAARAFCEEQLGLRLVSIQPVADYGFGLYFFSGDNEMPPDPDLEAVANREWLWERPYALLELQHKWEGLVEPPAENARNAGFIGFALRATQESELKHVAASDLLTWV